MTQTTDPWADDWRAPWASPSAGGSEPPLTADEPTTRPDLAPSWPPVGPPSGPSGRGRGRGRGRPGWAGVVAVGAGTALLSSLLTAGIMSTQDNTASTSFGSGSSGSSSVTQANPPVSGGSSTTANWEAVAKAVEPSVVSVKVSSTSASGEGSGIILDTKGHVLTNNHVVADAAGGGTITVVLNDGRGYGASVVGTDSSTDLAVIQIKNAPSDLKAATLGDSSAVQVGAPVMAIGNPLGLAGSVTTGIVSAVNRPVNTTSAQQNQDPNGGNGSTGTAESVVTNAIQTDAAVNPGNSGGALLDSGGRVIGITSSIASLGTSLGSSQSGSIGLGFAIPINEAKDVATQLISSGSAQHAWLGVSLGDGTVTVDGAQREAAVISTVRSGTPAAKAGVQVKDAIIAIDGQTTNGADSLVGTIRERRPGATVTLTLVRDGKTQQVKVTLGTKPSTTN